MFVVLEKKSITVGDDTIEAEGLSEGFENFKNTSAKAVKKLVTKLQKNPVSQL